jgi:hypothetical protein
MAVERCTESGQEALWGVFCEKPVLQHNNKCKNMNLEHEEAEKVERVVDSHQISNVS